MIVPTMPQTASMILLLLLGSIVESVPQLIEGVYSARSTQQLILSTSSEQSYLSKVMTRRRSLQREPVVNPCESEILEFSLNVLDSIDDDVALELYLYGTSEIAFLMKVMQSDSREDGEYFGVQGQNTTQILGIMEQLETFWSLMNPTLPYSSTPNSVPLLGVHGKDLEDTASVISLCETLELGDQGGTFFSSCEEYASNLHTLIQKLPGKYDNPLLAMNAGVSSSDTWGMEYQDLNIPTTMVIGDGMLNFFELSSADEDLALDFLLGHEFCHILQLDLEAFPASLPTAQASTLERLELMCDALSGYYLAHELGANLTASQVEHISLHAASIGDKEDSFQDLLYHGTPGQRECALLWGASHAEADGQNLRDAATLVGDFDFVYSDIRQGNSSICPGLTGKTLCSSSGKLSLLVSFGLVLLSLIVLS